MSKKIYLLSAVLSVITLMGASCISFTGGAAAGPMGLFMSADGGDSWVQKNTLLTAQGSKSLAGAKVYRIFTDPSDPKALYMATRGQGLFYSYDSGQTWSAFAAMDKKFVYALSVDPKDRCTIYVSDGPNIYKTVDCGREWKIVFTETRPSQRMVALANDYANPSIIYAAEIGGDVLRSKDGGASWRIIKNFNFELRELMTDKFNPQRIYAAAYAGGLYRSDDSGATWVQAGGNFQNFSGSSSFYRLVLHPTQRDSLFWISKYGILRSEDAGSSWSEIKLLTPPGSVNIYGFAIDPKNLSEIYYTGTILNDSNSNVRSTLYKSVDGGVNWVTKKLPTNTIPTDLLISKDSGKNIFIAFTSL